MDISKLQLAGRSLLTLEDLTDGQMLGLVELAAELKSAKQGDRVNMARHLVGRNIAVIFEKASTRTRCATMVAAFDEGANVEYLGKSDIHLGKKESVPDTARVLGRMFDGIMFRGYEHRTVLLLAEYAGVPVWNGLTDSAHPTQLLADLQTVQESFGRLKGLRAVYVGDGRNNVANSFMLGCAKAGIDFVNCCPPELAPAQDWVDRATAAAERNGSTVQIEHDPVEGVKGANVVYTDVWVSMGEESQYKQRVTMLRPYQVNMQMMEQTGNLASGDVIFLHCLPAFHNDETEVTAIVGPLEVTDDVFEAPYSKVFDEAENRMHTIKAVMVATIG